MWLSTEQIEGAAQALHERYVKAQVERGAAFRVSASWELLTESIRECNRAQVREFPELAERCGLVDTEALARGVHDCWKRYNPETAAPEMAGYEALPEAEKQKDRDVVSFLLQLYRECNEARL